MCVKKLHSDECKCNVQQKAVLTCATQAPLSLPTTIALFRGKQRELYATMDGGGVSNEIMEHIILIFEARTYLSIRMRGELIPPFLCRVVA